MSMENQTTIEKVTIVKIYKCLHCGSEIQKNNHNFHKKECYCNKCDDWNLISECEHLEKHPIEESTKYPPVDLTLCPVCKQKWVSQCKCPISERTCKNGHHWYQCPVHHKVIIGQSDHGLDSLECHCKPKSA